MSDFSPFADDAVSVSIGKLTIENGTDRVALYGSLDITRDRQGFARARALKALVDRIVEHLDSEEALPDSIPPAAKPKSVPNPFG